MNFFNFNPRRDANDADDATPRIEGERDTTNVNQGDSIQSRITKSALILLAVLVVVFAFYYYYADYFEKRRANRAIAAATVKDAKQVLSTNLPPLAPPVFPEPAPAAEAAPPPLAQQGSAPAGGAGGPKPLTDAELRLQRRLNAPLSFMSGGAAGGNAGNRAAAFDAGGADGVDGSGGASATKVSSAQVGKFSANKAYMMPNPSMIIPRGAGIPCNVRPAINTTLAGMVTCIQSADAYSADNKVKLLERETAWVGMQSVGLQQGMKRIGMIWQRARSPNHVLVSLNTGSGDALGRPGIDGDVNTHFWRRIGEAVAVSLISDVGSYLSATQKGGNNNTTIAFPGTTTGVQGVMSDMVKKSLDIPDILTKDPGAEIIIYIQEDIDFSDVYTLEVAQ